MITEANGIKVGWLGMTRWLNGNRNPDKDDQPHVNFFPYPGEAGGAPGADEATVLAAIKAARAQCDLLVISMHWGIEYATAPRPEDVDIAHKMMEAGATVIVGAHPHVLQPIETYKTQDGRDTVIFYSLGNFLSNQSRSYVDGLNPDSNGDPRDEMIGLFAAVKRDYGPAGVRVELGHVGMLPVWEENNRNEMAAGREKKTVIKPVLMDREIPPLQARLDELNKKAAQPGAELTADEKKEFIEVDEAAEAADGSARADPGASGRRLRDGPAEVAGETLIDTSRERCRREGTESAEKQPSTWMGAVMGVAMIPVLFVGACLAVPYTLGARWLRMHGEHKLRMLMKSRGRLMTWPEFVRTMHEPAEPALKRSLRRRVRCGSGGRRKTCARNRRTRSSTGSRCARAASTSRSCTGAARATPARTAGSAILVDAPLVPRREIYALWSECRSDAMKAEWIEVAPPEILPHEPGQ